MDASVLIYFTDIINIQSFLIGLVTLLIIRWFMTRPKYRYNLPPGPMSFPIIGNLPQMFTTVDLDEKIKELRKQYGDIFRIKIGSDDMIMVCKTEWILEGLVKKGDQLKGRSYWLYFFDKVFERKGIFFNIGKEWKDTKKFTISKLRNLGMGKRKLEDQIYFETQLLSEEFESYNGKPFSMNNPTVHFSMNVIHNIIFGKRCQFGEIEFDEIAEQFRYFFKHTNVFVPENFVPFLRFFLWNSPTEQIIKNEKMIRKYIKKRIMEHKETFNAEYIRDFIDTYLLTLEKEPSSEFLSEPNIIRTIIDIFTGGTDAIAIYLIWAFLYMAKYPDVQNKCREEIKQVTNLNRPVKMEDKRHLNYVAATLLEIHRIASVIPITAPHVAEVDTTLGGYDIPAKSVVSFMLVDAHHDPNHWDKPEEFRPERWIGVNNELLKHEAFMPFSLGPRICAGVSLSNIEIFVAFTNILQRFQIERPDETPMTMEGKQTGITYIPVKDSIRVVAL